ncbi:MAG: hypothetical protein ACLTXM_17815 [Enterococcus sp.]
MKKIFDWMTIGLTFALTISALGVVGSFEQGRLDTAGFFIGQAVCIASISLLAVIHHLLSKKKALEERQLLLRAKKNIYIKSIADRRVCVNDRRFFDNERIFKRAIPLHGWISVVL